MRTLVNVAPEPPELPSGLSTDLVVVLSPCGIALTGSSPVSAQTAATKKMSGIILSSGGRYRY